MEKNIEKNKKTVKVEIWAAVIIGLMATAHFTINYFDFPGFLGFLKALHGG